MVGEGKRGPGCVLATPPREWRLSGSASKNGTSCKRFQRSLFNRRGCATSVYRFWKLHLGRCDKDSARPSLPFLTWRMIKLHLNLFIFLNHLGYAGEHISKRSACEAMSSDQFPLPSRCTNESGCVACSPHSCPLLNR